jgi:glycosyltransferase involved in cell wall biosynthesis
MHNEDAVISVIITTKNEEKNIGNCLESIRKQDFPLDKIEIIIVDNNSSDRTKEMAAGYTDRIFNLGPERSQQRNFGIRQARGRYILYLDADMVLSSNVVAECVHKCEREGIDALYIPERIIGRGFWIKVRDFERSFYNATVIDCVRFLRKVKFLEIGGFDESLIGPEDWDFDRRIRAVGKTGIIAAELFHNEGKFSLKKYLKKKGYYVESFQDYVNKWGKNDPTLKKQLGFPYRYFGVFVENGKWKKLIKNPFLGLAVYFLKIALGFRYSLNYFMTLFHPRGI